MTTNDTGDQTKLVTVMLFARCPNPYACQANPKIVAQYQMLRLSRVGAP